MWTLLGFDDLPPFMSVPAAAEVLGVSRSTGYACVADGTLPAIKVRGRLLISRYELFKIVFRFRVPAPA